MGEFLRSSILELDSIMGRSCETKSCLSLTHHLDVS